MRNEIEEILDYLVNKVGERPVGSPGNDSVLWYLEQKFMEMGYRVKSLGFDCFCWGFASSSVKTSKGECNIHPGPFSESFHETCPVEFIETIDQLEASTLDGKICILSGAIASDPLMPKDFPFFYPEGHKRIITTLEALNPKAVIAVTGKHSFCGLNPFPLFDDGNFTIPSAYTNPKTAKEYFENEVELTLTINSWRNRGKSHQLVAKTADRRSRKIVICGHMDTAYNTPGALDNASGIAVLLETAAGLSNYKGPFDLEFVPFNGEEYYGVGGQLAYLEEQIQGMKNIALVINIDSPGHVDSKTAISMYNFDALNQKKIGDVMNRHVNCIAGSEWIAGDHSIFSFQKIPCIAITSSNLEREVIDISHTPNDTMNLIDPDRLNEAVAFLKDYIASF